jgi:hypothetical protein
MLDAYEADGDADLRALAGALVRPSAAIGRHATPGASIDRVVAVPSVPWHSPDRDRGTSAAVVRPF